jgi:hypothetical protein
MRLSTNELRARAQTFVASHKGDSDENKHTQTFWNDFFFEIFGVKRTRVAVFEQSVDKLKGAKGRIDLFWPGELLIEQKSLGRDLQGARIQALDYTHGLTDAEMPKRILTCDFKTWELLDLTTNQTTAFTLDELPKHIDLFGFVLGRQTRIYKDQDPVNIKASELVAKLHDLLLASGYKGHKLEVFLTRIVFCLFADDTGIFEPKDILWDFLDTRTATDGGDMGAKLGELFTALNTPEADRQTSLDSDIARFPYINGHLFEEYFPPPAFDADMRAALLNACRFDWTPISPAIFGSLFQSVMDAGERRKAGAHYTTEKNILKLIGPLFMDDLRAEFAAIKSRRSGRDAALRKFHDKLASLTFFDPACGAGNFLIIAYREIRRLELELLLELRSDTQLVTDASALSRVDVDQFYGIEISEFPARIAETALWMMDHLMNLELSAAFGQYYPRIPLKKAPTIVHGDALELDWANILPPERCSYMLGNPPFIGQSYQSRAQREQMRRLTNPNGKTASPLDYVGAWFLKAGAYVQGATRIAFVSTNSITQGENVGLLWPALFDKYGLEITFAHRTFAWGSDARGKAHVHVVIMGMERAGNTNAARRLFSYADINGEPIEEVCKAITAYLTDGSRLMNANIVVTTQKTPLDNRPRMLKGSGPTDDGNLLLSETEKELLLSVSPKAKKFIRRTVGSQDTINGVNRYCLWLVNAAPNEIKEIPQIVERLRAVRAFRLASTKEATRQDADRPSEFAEIRHTEEPYVLIPRVSSERREYVPMTFHGADVIANDSAIFLANAKLADFALLNSLMHMAWMKAVCGRLESRYRYSIGLVYNTFPLPPTANLSKLEPLAQAILDARAAHPSATLADLYDPDLMPPNLRAAHTALDRAVDKLYRPAGFNSDRERVEHLFALYESMQAPLLTQPKRRKPKPPVT